MQYQICLMVYEEEEFQGGVLLPQGYESATHALKEADLLNDWSDRVPWPVVIHVITGPAKKFSDVKKVSLKHFWPDWEDHWPL